ncbi:hypothetical protein CDD80_35 [Ophiocordyceps camponoti-rufipedis]|uniref:BZIP domain-containing protein n=1 Tax=Ophiocordyceps camponoti-rufipedis TaxID=2004952 RepID=A0A2C5ZN23_9HYPO|nr:hypothetical protein CDD80_35 [Ophiocordyceps camponoti-rufipedis]
MIYPVCPVQNQHSSALSKFRIQSAPPESVLYSPQLRKRFATADEARSIVMGAARPSRHGKKQCLSPPAIKPKSGAKDVNWADVTDPEERRRIQNRIAQRKFRGKARENREKAERESRNQQHAGNSYRIPVGTDIAADHELSGLPWGSMSLGLVVSRGHEAESLRSSGRGTYVGDEPYASPHSHYAMPLASELPDLPQASYYGSSVGEDVFFDDASYGYDYDAALHFEDSSLA